jgi:hypothetical protein
VRLAELKKKGARDLDSLDHDHGGEKTGGEKTGGEKSGGEKSGGEKTGKAAASLPPTVAAALARARALPLCLVNPLRAMQEGFGIVLTADGEEEDGLVKVPLPRHSPPSVVLELVDAFAANGVLARIWFVRARATPKRVEEKKSCQCAGC